jgi:branched-chain amino acid transport system substrate-binding protein
VKRLWRGGTALLSVGALLLAAACGSGGSSGASGGKGKLPAEIKLVSVNDLTGPAAFAGLSANKGYELALDEINKQHYLGGSTKLVLDKKDPAGQAQTAATQVSAAIADRSINAIFGPVTSGEAVAAAPIADKAKMPIIFTQAGSEGVVIGPYTFRATPPMSSYYPRIADYLKEKNVKTISIIYNAAFPTLKEIGEKVLPSVAQQNGVTIKSSTGVQTTTQDFTAPIAKLVGDKPDAAAILLVGAANATGMKQLRQAGYTGPVIGNAGAGGGNLKPAGVDAAGLTWPTDFHPDQKAKVTQDFVAAYKAKYGEAPLNYAAEAYDAAWWLARGIKSVGSAERVDIQKGVAAVAKQGFDGAMGKLTFEGNDLRVPGALVQWDGTKEILLKDYNTPAQ